MTHNRPVRHAETAEAARPTETCQSSSDGSLQGKRVLIGLGEFSEGLETYYMVYRLMEEGAVPVVAAPVIKQLQTVCHDYESQYIAYSEKIAYLISAEIAFEDVDPDAFDALLLPGGRAPEEIRQNADLIRITNSFLKNEKPLGAMCHGVQILYTNYPLKGRRMTAYYGIRPDMENVGIEFVDAAGRDRWCDRHVAAGPTYLTSCRHSSMFSDAVDDAAPSRDRRWSHAIGAAGYSAVPQIDSKRSCSPGSCSLIPHERTGRNRCDRKRPPFLPQSTPCGR